MFATAILPVVGETGTLSRTLVFRGERMRGGFQLGESLPRNLDRSRLPKKLAGCCIRLTCWWMTRTGKKSGLAGTPDVEKLPCLVPWFLKDHRTHRCVVAGLWVDIQGSDECL